MVQVDSFNRQAADEMQSSLIVVVVGILLVLGSVSRGRQIDVGQIFDESIAETEDALNILRIIGKPRAVSTKYVGFSWNDCSSSSSLVQVKSVTLIPDPLSLPGNVTLAFNADVVTDLPTTISVDLIVEKKIGFFWLTIPCVDHIGSCKLENICSTTLPCPEVFPKYGIPCQCPIKKGNYNLPSSPLNVNVGVPSGEYRVTANVHSQSTNIGCIHVEVAIA